MAIISCVILLAITLLKNAWLCDDAYITLRVADNFVHGYGLTWNVFERVQAYTHPLWLFVLTAVYAITREAFFTMIFVSVAVSFAAVILYAFKVARTTILAILGVVTLTLSSAFIDYSTSGLENPLTFLILAAFLYVYFKKEITLDSLFVLSLIAALGMLNRLDTLLIYFPMLAYAFWKVRSGKAVVRVVLGFLPLIIWMMFSLAYYGFLVPNTAYAKLNTGVPAMTLMQHGGYYLYISLLNDPLTIVVLAAAIIMPLFRRKPIYIMTSLGILLYLAYIVKIGGCYMAGRHLAAPFFAGVMLLSQYRRPSKFAVIPAAIIILALGLFNGHSPVYASDDETKDTYPMRYGITDERSWMTPTHGLMNNIFGEDARWTKDWVIEGKAARESGIPFKFGYAIGMISYYAGPHVNVLDVNALTDPLLARLELYPGTFYRVGHFTRIVPPGYPETIVRERNLIADSSLAKYYDHLTTVTRGPVLDWNRFGEIVAFNLGRYDHLVDAYESPHVRKIPLSLLQVRKRPGTRWSMAGNVVYEQEGVDVILPESSHAPRIELSHDYNDLPLGVAYLRGGKELAEQIIPYRSIEKPGLAISNIDVPEAAFSKGYDIIHIYPHGGESPYSIGHIRLTDTE